MSDPRTVTVNVLVTKPLEIEEPDWCAGHSDDRAEFKADITHKGREHVLKVGGFPLFRAMLAQAPYSQHAPSAPCLYVEQLDLTGSYTPDEVEDLADALVEVAARLRALGRELDAVLEEEGR
ncbi:DUF6907 domain-containing protein [Streptomyces djakartensis]|uniref:Uncharacterized protein n=1 Tax=Streptomyces djakartensis TaxID=68193 RepID=A0ABQ2ZYX5_9ACTN|nr:hypothetical protein [Streptomyces djakartensis]GGY27486.1 hypothetical protein GCM10010384_38240 [Streptomyces djakartensis]